MAETTRREEETNPDYVLRKRPTHKENKAHRTELKTGGTKGPALQKEMRGWRKDIRAGEGDRLKEEIPDDFERYVKHPRRFLKSVVRGQGPAMRRLMRLREADKILGNNKNKNRLTDEYGRQMDALSQEAPDQAGSKIEVERDFQEAPTFTAFQRYVGQHIDPETGEAIGLTQNEENTIRRQGSSAVNNANESGMRNEMTRMAAAGMDPRSGVGADRAMQMQASRENDLGDLEGRITESNLQRKQQFEDYAQNLGRAEEQRRQFDVSGDLRRLADVEQGEFGLAGLDENARQFDYTYTEGQRQAKKEREARARAAKSLEPSTLEKWGSGISGFIGGVTGGGGGGAFGSM